jgi:aspartyl-tRNA(Asn)/glutamyl-tRNA(Gln) amidotransferase subunit A
VFTKQGAEIREVSLPHTRYAIDTYYLLCTSEVSSNLSRFEGVRYGHRTSRAEA